MENRIFIVLVKKCFYIYLIKAIHMPCGVGIAQWLEHQTHNRKVPGSNPGRSGGWIFFSRVNFLCWLLFWYPFNPHVTAVACKRSLSFCQKCRWQVTAKHTYTLPMWLWMKWHCKQVYGWMVYTELALRWQQFHMAPAMQQQMSVIRTPLPWILKICATKRIQSLIWNHMWHVRSESVKSRQ